MRKDWNQEGFRAYRIDHFRALSPDSFTVFMLLDDEGPIGYAAWNLFENKEEDPTLRQIYIVPQNRRKGYGTYLFTESRKLFSDAPTMVVERPNSTFVNLLCKLDLAEKHDKTVTGKGVMFC
jgi:GNAT superfamily N-acetyltransferase